ncbi:MAG: hypothetical protein J5983_05265, partial [Ruminococcus sp.]|nr:hypothetical protein [Ruminococcus sp.]
MALAVMLIFFSGWMANISARDNVYQLSRRYILQMEAEGCLNSSLESRLRSDLATAGMSNVSLSGTTTSEVDYGNVIVLKITGDLKVNSYSTTGFLQLVRTDSTLPLDIELASTAKN